MLVHDDSPQLVEVAGVLHRLGEEIREVVVRVDEGYLDLEGLDHVADEEVASLDVLDAVVVLRVVGDVARGLAVRGETRGPRLAGGEAGDEFAGVDQGLGRLRQRDERR